MGFGNDKAGFCGHGVGLELDEPPVISRNSKAVLVPGHVIALEPKFTFPGEGVVGWRTSSSSPRTEARS